MSCETSAVVAWVATPRPDTVPEVWLLGASAEGATTTARFGLPFALAHFIAPQVQPSIVHAYRQEFRPSAMLPHPRASIAIAAACAETREEAERLSWTRWAMRTSPNRLGGGALLPPEEAMAFPYSPLERLYLEITRERSLFGDPPQVKERLLAIADAVDEILLVTNTYDFAARLRSYALIARAFGLEPEAPLSAIGESRAG